MFLWKGDASKDIDGLIIRTIELDGIVSGSFDVELSTDICEINFQDENGIFIRPSNLVTNLNPTPATISWDFGSFESRVIDTSMTILSSDMSTELEEMHVSIVKVEQDTLYRVVVLSSPSDLSVALSGQEDPEFTLLYADYVTHLPGEYNFNLSQDSEEYLYIIIHNWSTKEFVLDDYPMSQFISHNFDELLEEEDRPPLVILNKAFGSNSLLNVGSGVSVFITPLSQGIPSVYQITPQILLTQTPINELDGRYQVNLTSLGQEGEFPLAGAQIGIEPMVFTWDEGSGGGCSALGFIPGSLLILLPLFLLFKKR